ncbi:hypothetical protein C3733_00310 [Bacillus amyloliquefaciens]|nr:hypothetical protein C3733_00310 [Bacillus amyloliquefaciens]
MKCFLLSGSNSGSTKLVSWIKKNGIKISADKYCSTGKEAGYRTPAFYLLLKHLSCLRRQYGTFYKND